MGIGGAMVFPFAPPPIQGLGSYGGFEFVVQDIGQHSLDDFSKITNDLVRQGGARKDLAGLFSDFTANDPQLLVTLDRDKAKSLHVPIKQITDTLQVYMGSAYVNDFDFNNRSYRVYVPLAAEGHQPVLRSFRHRIYAPTG